MSGITYKESQTTVDILQINSASDVIGTPRINIVETTANGSIRHAFGATLPTDGDAGYALGCRFVLTGSTADKTFYINVGSETSAAFRAISVDNNATAGISNVKVAHAIYSFGTDGGAVGAITPALNATIPANAIIIGGTINSTTAVTSGGSATIAVGTTAGSSATSLLGATGKASFSLDALINSVATFAAPVKMSAAGQIQLTVATAALTAGVIEVFVYYTVAANA